MGLFDSLFGKAIACQYCNAALAFKWDRPKNAPEIKVTRCPDCHGFNVSIKNITYPEREWILTACDVARKKVLKTEARLGKLMADSEAMTVFRDELADVQL